MSEHNLLVFLIGLLMGAFLTLSTQATEAKLRAAHKKGRKTT